VKKLYIIIFIIVKSSTAAGVLTLSSSKLDNPSAQVGFFDPHNHTSGVVPPLALVNIYKYIYGTELTTSELKRFWSSVINYFLSEEKLKDDERMSSGTKMLLRCNDAMRFCSKLINDAQCREKIIDGINNLFSSTPLTGFSTAYGLRTALFDIPDVPKVTPKLRAQAMLFELAKNKVDLVEMSKVFLLNTLDKDSTKDFVRFAQITEDLRSPNTSEKNLDFKKRLEALKLEVPRIKWLLLTHSLQLGKSSDTTTVSYADGRCKEMAMPLNLDIDPSKAIYSVLVDYKDVVGVDVAGPELTCFTKRGMEEFKKLAETTYQASKAKRQEKSHKGKLLVRVHVGEGFPINTPTALVDNEQSCAGIKKFPEIETVHDRVKQSPIHRVEARKNIEYILEAIKELKEQYKDINDYVVFRLGHLTHIDSALAQKAKKLGVAADVNLNSNLATGAWPVPQEIINEYLIKKNVTPDTIRSLREALVNNGASLGKVFDGHGLKTLLYHKVPVTLGSDGAGVEHSQSMREEYLLAKQLIDYWNANDHDFASKNITIDDLLLNQKYHYDVMGYAY